MRTEERPPAARSRRFEAELPVGYLDADGRMHRSAHLRKMTGQEEALLSDRKLRQNGPALVTELLASCLCGLGELDTVNRRIVSELSSPDRNYLLVELRKITFGHEIESSYGCPGCGETTTVVHDLEELPIRRLADESTAHIVVDLVDGCEDPSAGEDAGAYYTMVFRLPTGTDEEKIAPALRENASRGMNALLARCLTSVGDMPDHRREALGTKLINDLTMADRARIEQAFRQEMPGYDLTQEFECGHCGRGFRASLDLTRFFSLQPAAPNSSGTRFLR